MRQLDVTLTADSNPVAGANVILKNADGEATGSAVTDSNGEAADMTFMTQVVDLSGFNQLSLAGYEAVTVAKVGSYYYNSASDNAGDFRYAMDSVSLVDQAGNSYSMALTNSVDVQQFVTVQFFFVHILCRTVLVYPLPILTEELTPPDWLSTDTTVLCQQTWITR